MQFANPFSLSGQWYKGNLHTHTTNSDGGNTPEEMLEAYRAAGYDFFATTDHGFVTEIEAVPDGFLWLRGVELDGDVSEVGECFHVVGFGLTQPATPPPHPKVPEAIAWIAEQGGLSVMAHPYWSGLTYRDLGAEGPIGLEVYNAVCEYLNAKGSSSVHWDDVLSRGRRWWGLGVDDAHAAVQSGKAWVVVKAEALSREAIVEAMRAGCFYSSTGPTIEAVEVGEEIRVRTSPVTEINFMAPSWRGRPTLAPAGETICEAAFTPRGDESYVRIEVCDAQGRRAWTNPVVWKEEQTTEQ